MFFDRFEALCKQRGISKQKACLDCGLSRTAWNKWRAGAVPNGDAVQSLSDYFGVTTDYLLTGSEAEKAPTQAGERKSDLDAAKIALFGGDTEVTDEMWDEAVLAAEIIKARYKRKKD